MNIKWRAWLALLVSFAIATVFVLILQPHLFNEPILPFSISNKELEEWTESIFGITNFILFILGFVVLLIWILIATSSKFTKATDALSKGFFWWLFLIGYWLLGIVIIMSISFFSGWMDGGKDMEPSYWLSFFVLIDGVVLFWLPSAIGTPGSMRYVPPFAMTLRKFYGG